MLLPSRSWLYATVLRRAYTTSMPLPELQLAQPIQPQMQLFVPTISTLRPEKLVYSDFLVFAGSPFPAFRTPLPLPSPPKHKPYRLLTRLHYKSYKYLVDERNGAKHNLELEDDGTATTASKVVNKVKRTVGEFAPFPECARGFLYLHEPQPESYLPRSASSIRFRCAPSLVEVSSSFESAKASAPPPWLANLEVYEDDKAEYDSTFTSNNLWSVSILTPCFEKPVLLPPSLTNPEIYEAFKAGYDLTLPDGTPWSVPASLVAVCPFLKEVRVQLLKDKLFSESELQEYGSIYKSTTSVQVSNPLYTLGGVFYVRFDKTQITVWPTTAEDEGLKGERTNASQAKSPTKTGRAVFKKVFLDGRTKYGEILPYTGAALARFELAAGIDLSKPALSIRIVKMVELVECVVPDYDGYINMPKEGELVTRGLPGKKEPWICRLSPSVRKHSAMLLLVPATQRT